MFLSDAVVCFVVGVVRDGSGVVGLPLVLPAPHLASGGGSGGGSGCGGVVAG